MRYFAGVALVTVLLLILCTNAMAGRNDAEGYSGGFELYELVKPVGIATLVIMLATAGAGLFMRRKPKLLLKWHKRLAALVVAAAVLHAILVVLTH